MCNSLIAHLTDERVVGQRSIQPRIDQAPGVVSKKSIGISKLNKATDKLSVAPQQVFQKKPEAPLIKKHDETEMREIEKGVELSWEDAEKRLREWDMNSRFGPCMSVTRLARWERAKKLEMDPPEFIHNVLKAFPELKDKSIWHNRIHPDEPIIGV